ncbi:Licheninase [Nitritalea halalkaliphila LW7]|uniref:Licheninase n=1 Tax=Nitritalea halalkaliphila LW7 TaxID=1189621 RepID=I5C866_9BACT|nr:family 16 glycosylhydrolase [Nitritalea halalkaliphila]EIM78018.1 Licheninase [Nitritalea halalkaliphila LW7]
MKRAKNQLLRRSLAGMLGAALLWACSPETKTELLVNEEEELSAPLVHIPAHMLHAASSPEMSAQAAEEGPIQLKKDQWIALDVEVPEAGRYQLRLSGEVTGTDSLSIWVEDYYDNPDDRTYDISGKMHLASGAGAQEVSVDGSPLRAGMHKMKVHVDQGEIALEYLQFLLLVPHKKSENVLEQRTSGTEWTLVWSDEFDGDEIDESKWTYDIGNWGWGNNELQYYTANRPENARLLNGHLIIEARKEAAGPHPWTSARLTTRGKVAFKYGKIEFRAIVPKSRGNWAAGWTLGNTYVDEKDWPYCGEIDILESVGYEIDPETGAGTAHATVHTPAYYFKIGNQIGAEKRVADMANEFQTYAVEWTPTSITMLVNDTPYYTYDKIADEREWPFHTPQDIILNLAIGGGWGGAKGLDPNMEVEQFILDYVRVYEKR